MSSKYSHVSDTYGGKTPNLGMFNMSVSNFYHHIIQWGYESLTVTEIQEMVLDIILSEILPSSTNCTKYVTIFCSKVQLMKVTQTQYVIKYYKKISTSIFSGK